MLSSRATAPTKVTMPTIVESPIEDMVDSTVNTEGSGILTNQTSLSCRPLGKLYNENEYGTLLHHTNKNTQFAEKEVMCRHLHKLDMNLLEKQLNEADELLEMIGKENLQTDPREFFTALHLQTRQLLEVKLSKEKTIFQERLLEQKDDINRDISEYTDLCEGLAKQLEDIQNEIPVMDNAIEPSLKGYQCEEEIKQISIKQDDFDFSLDSTELETMTPITTPMKPAPPIWTTPLRGKDYKVALKSWWHIEIRNTWAHQCLDISSWMFLCLVVIYLGYALVCCIWAAAEKKHERQFLLLMNHLTHGDFQP